MKSCEKFVISRNKKFPISDAQKELNKAKNVKDSVEKYIKLNNTSMIHEYIMILINNSELSKSQREYVISQLERI